MCDFRAKVPKDVKTHKDKNHAEDRLKHKCTQCEYVSAWQANKQRHFKRAHEGISEHKCDICGQEFSVKVSLKAHQYSVHKVGNMAMLKCDQCDYQTIHKGALKTHIQGVHEDKPRPCELCGKVLKNGITLEIHIRMMHRSDRKIHKCPVCHKEYFKLDVMKEHLQVKHGEGIHEKHHCEFCEYYTYRKSHLRLHKCYRKIKECIHCSFKADTSNKMKIHVQKEHTSNPAKISCDFCEFTTFIKGSMARHLKTHAGAKPFKCEQCEKHFTRSDSLSIHILLLF